MGSLWRPAEVLAASFDILTHRTRIHHVGVVHVGDWRRSKPPTGLSTASEPHALAVERRCARAAKEEVLRVRERVSTRQGKQVSRRTIL